MGIAAILQRYQRIFMTHINQHALMSAVNLNDIEAVRIMLHRDTTTWNPDDVLCFACQKGRLEIVQLLIGVANPNAHDGRPLQMAVGNGHYEVVKFLLPHCDATVLRSEALQMSVLNADVVMFDMLYPHSDCATALGELEISIQEMPSDYKYDECQKLHARLIDIVNIQKQNAALRAAVEHSHARAPNLLRKI